MHLGQSPSIAIVTRETRLKKLIGRFSTRSAAKFRVVMAHSHRPELWKEKDTSNQSMPTDNADDAPLAAAEFEEYQEEDSIYQNNFELLRRDLDFGYPVKIVERKYLPVYDFRGCVAVVVLGQDGLVANAAKYVGDLPIVAVNPDPERNDGILLTYPTRQALDAVKRTIEGKAKIRRITLAEVNLNDGQRMLAFNDLFLGCGSHASARYTLRLQDRAEAQSSSGIIIATGAGSTGWLSSMFNMVEGFTTWLGEKSGHRIQLNWEDRQLVWAVREPFKSKCSSVGLVAGMLNEHEEIMVESLMPNNGVIFSDGIESDFLEFNTGSIARIKVAKQCAHLVVE
jgi:NAD kinase